MIKSIHKLVVPKRDKDYAALVAFFEALGLRRGESWDGRRSKGVKFDAREAGIEIGMGEGFPKADLVIEVDSADVVYQAITSPPSAKSGRKGGPPQTRKGGPPRTRKGGPPQMKIVEKIADADWGARMFTVDMPAGAGRLCIFSYNEDWRAQNTREGKLDATGLRFAIVVSRFNAFITERLLAGAQDALFRFGADPKNIHVVHVPGAFEIPTASRTLAKTKKYDAILCIGCLLRGDTAHYDVIVNECTRGIGQSAQETGVPHAFGVLTCETLEQAIDRAGLKMGNKGFEAGMAAIEMAKLQSSVVSLQSS
ncbi:MAG: 6,7-dimethyl-8-ribityllumazine synthase, partial [Terriglobales bacterium]